MNPPLPGPAPLDQVFYTLEEISERWRCHPQTVRNLIGKKQLKAHRVGRLFRVRREELERFENEPADS